MNAEHPEALLGIAREYGLLSVVDSAPYLQGAEQNVTTTITVNQQLLAGEILLMPEWVALPLRLSSDNPVVQLGGVSGITLTLTPWGTTVQALKDPAVLLSARVGCRLVLIMNVVEQSFILKHSCCTAHKDPCTVV